MERGRGRPGELIRRGLVFPQRERTDAFLGSPGGGGRGMGWGIGAMNKKTIKGGLERTKFWIWVLF